MRAVAFLLIIAFQSVPSTTAFCQHSDEALIRKLEDMEKEAIRKGDTTQLAMLMSENIVVHNPENMIAGYRTIVDRIKAGKINYASFDRIIEKISIVNGIAIVMGQETIVPQGETKHAGKTVIRRFSNIWTKEGDVWKLTARQATNVSIN